MTKMSPEVLIYVQTVKNYLNSNKEARDYFIGDNSEELFFEHLSIISEKNFDTNGDAMLNKEQFELLRKTLFAIAISKKEIPEDPMDKIFLDIEGFGKYCLN